MASIDTASLGRLASVDGDWSLAGGLCARNGSQVNGSGGVVGRSSNSVSVPEVLATGAVALSKGRDGSVNELIEVGTAGWTVKYEGVTVSRVSGRG